MISASVVRSLLPEGFKIIRSLSHATFGRVDLVSGNDGYYVAKTVSDTNFHKMESEVLELAEFIHPNIVRGISYSKSSRFHQILFEYCPEGDLFDKAASLTDDQIVIIAGQIAKVLMFCHSLGIVHADIKSENILVQTMSPFHVKLADFGLAFRPPYSFIGTRGTYEFMSPEMMNRKYDKISFPTDMWSFGVFLYELIYDGVPFGSRDESSDSIDDSIRELKNRINKVDFKFPHNKAPIEQDFISRLLVADPEKRMTAQQCLEHPFLNAWYRNDLVKDIIRDRAHVSSCLM